MALTKEEREWAEIRLQYHIDSDDLDYTDNFRYAEVGDTKEMQAYDEARENGCCGYFDTAEVCPKTGKRIRMGCNYGH